MCETQNIDLRLCILVDNHIAGGVDSFLRTLIPRLSRMNPDLSLIANSTYPGVGGLIGLCSEKTTVRLFSSVFHRRWFTRVGVRPRSAAVEKFLGAMRRVSELAVLPFEVLRLRRDLPVPAGSVLFIVNGGYPGSYLALAAALAFSKRHAVVMNIHNYAVPRGMLTRTLDRLLDCYVNRSVDLFVGVSQSSALSLVQRMKTAAERNVYIYNAVDSALEPPTHREILSASKGSDRYVLALVGTLEERKGHHFALQVFAELQRLMPDRGLVLRFTGSDPFRRKGEICRLAEQLGCLRNVEFKDHESDRRALYADTDLLLVPSTVRESFGLVAIEALSVGIPVVASSTGALPEILGGVPGAWVMPRLLVDDWVRMIQKLVESGQRAPTDVLHSPLARFFDPDRMALEYLEAIVSLSGRVQTDR